jgi:hypothetical protein
MVPCWLLPVLVVLLSTYEPAFGNRLRAKDDVSFLSDIHVI